MGLLEHSEGIQIHGSDGTGLGKQLVRRSPNPQGWRCKGPNMKPLKETQQGAKGGRASSNSSQLAQRGQEEPGA